MQRNVDEMGDHSLKHAAIIRADDWQEQP
jgi:hypothetical protein